MAIFTWIGVVSVSTGWSTASAWFDNTTGATATVAPATGDTVNFDASAVGAMTGDNQSAITVAQMNLKSAFTQTVGTQGSPLQIGATIIRIGDTAAGQTGNGSGRINLNLGSVQSTILVLNTAGSGLDSGLEPVRIKGTNASNSIEVLGGTVGIATDSNGDAATFAAVNMSSGIVDVGAGATITAATIKGGVFNSLSCPTTLTQYGGSSANGGTGSCTTANLYGGKSAFSCRPASGNTVGTLLLAGGIADFTGNPLAATIGALTLGNGSLFTFSESQLTITATTFSFGPLGQFTVGAQ